MKVYHTGRVAIPRPDLLRGRKNADFGQGFYLTPDRDFTRRWAVREAVINVYELDLTGLEVVTLERNEEWFRYIFSNRRARDTKEADVVIGPIANDTLYDTMGIISSGFLKDSEALSLLQIGPVYTQIAIKTEKALGQLTFMGTEEFEKTEEDEESLRREEEQYREELAKVMKSWEE